MNGFSIFLSSDIDVSVEQYIHRMKKSGFSGVFTSLHIPEDNPQFLKSRLKKLGNITKKENLTLMADISSTTIDLLNLKTIEDYQSLQELGLTGLRIDYGIAPNLISELSHIFTVGLNASTMTEADYKYLLENNADFDNIEYWHNYYPRPETGLGKHDFIKKNTWLKSLNGEIVAFVAGDNHRRGPLYEGLPTLEKHRNNHPLASCLELQKECHVDKVYVGDSGLSSKTIEQFEDYYYHQRVLLEVDLLTSSYSDLVLGSHTNRFDSSRDVIRSQSARFKKIPHIPQLNNIERSIGSVTLDNYLYGRYQGEFQLVKKDLTASPRVNVMGKICCTDLPLLSFIDSGVNYKLIERK
ncbi:MupG family TIM beta-alpha barrel fold protein [Vagococcus vulneris]|uniref:MupG family TIM beta-alpha barrel fold protein n=1 Tax=Vagococcus vulneris TaxID=1977869 RepID=UPI001403D149|nr:MupG family TIM beta-alpha barrel fold protein [Vagococcus vulneris]